MSFIREFRIIPVVLIAINCLVVLKIAGLLLDGGYIFNDTPVPSKPSWAQETFNFPAGRKAPDPDVTGSIDVKKDDKPAIVSPASTHAPDEVVVIPDQTRPITASERAVLERLQSRRQEIEARGREIDIRENLMKSAEKRIEGKIEEMKAAESRITVATAQRDEAEAARFKGLVTTYENMRPKDAAKVFDRLDISVLFDIASQINPRKMSDIIGQMQPDAAERLTVEMARRASADKSVESSLPKIEGRPLSESN